MPVRTVQIEGIGTVAMQKHRASRSIRLSLGADGTIKVTLPSWTPYKVAEAFVLSRRTWIVDHLQTPTALESGMAVGKTSHLYFKAVTNQNTITSKRAAGQLYVLYPQSLNATDAAVQAEGRKIAVAALRREAAKQLPIRLATLAQKHGFTFSSVKVRILKARWGSCDHKQNITLNLYLLQLPWELIDYVLLHELTHTEVLNHSVDFWKRFDQALPGAKKMRTKLKTYKPWI